MARIGFKEARRKVVAALLNGTYQHEAERSEVETKNLLLMGQVTPETICDVLRRCQGPDHATSPHHQAPSIDVHIIRRDGWYIKFYFVDPDTVFISVHQ